jgi:ribosome-associated heat shock protein Hsp15
VPDRSQSFARVRLDVWLDVACVFKTRSEAQRACLGGKVDVNGARGKPNRDLKVGDVLTITRPLGRRQTLRVAGLAEAHIPKAEARLLYEDITPPPTPEEQALLDLLRLTRPQMPQGTPTRDMKRERRRMKESYGTPRAALPRRTPAPEPPPDDGD